MLSFLHAALLMTGQRIFSGDLIRYTEMFFHAYNETLNYFLSMFKSLKGGFGNVKFPSMERTICCQQQCRCLETTPGF
jgi:hypothetical protein